MISTARAFSPGFNPNQLDMFISQKGMEKTDGIAPAAHAGDEQIGKASLESQELRAGFFTNNLLKIPDDGWIGMRAGGGPKAVEGVPGVSNPVS